MKHLLAPAAFCVACLSAVTFPHRAFSEPDPKWNAQALLDEAKKGESERRIAAKQTVANRMNEDIKKAKQQIDALDQSIYKVADAAAGAGKNLDKLAVDKKRLAQELELTNLRIETEKLKQEGLILLGIAHAKGREAMEKTIQETDLKLALAIEEVTRLEGAHPEPIAAGPKAKTSKRTEGSTDLAKRVFKAEQAAATANSSARLAMETASTKLRQADAAAARMEKKEAELDLEKNPSLPGGNDPLKPTGRK